MKLLQTSAVALSLLISAAPLAVLADDGANASGDVEVQASTSGSGEHGGIGAGLRADLRGLFGRPGMEQEGEFKGSLNASSSTNEPHMGERRVMASGTPSMGEDRGQGNGMKVRAHGDGEIDARITMLNKMISRIDGAERLTDDAKTSLKAELEDQITSLTNLKAQIDTEATTSLKGDTQSITKDFRIYALVLPKAAITAASDRIMTVVGQMEAFSAKLTTRITAAQTAGADVSAAVTAHTDFDAKVADAKVQAQAAASEVVNLSPDNGATTTLQANTTALKDAKSKIDAAQKDLQAARKDIGTILSAIRGKGEVKATATTTASAS